MSVNGVPKTLLIEFFQRAIFDLERYGRCADAEVTVGEASPKDTMVGCGSAHSFLEQHRLNLLSIQTDALSDVVENYTNLQIMNSDGGGTTVTVDMMRSALLNATSSSVAEIRNSAQAMNDAARLAVARSILSSLIFLISSFSSSSQRGRVGKISTSRDCRKMGRMDILEFCGLSTAAAHLPEVRYHLRTGYPLSFDNSGAVDNEDASMHPSVAATTPEERLERLQTLLLRFVMGHAMTIATEDIVDLDRQEPSSMIVAEEINRIVSDAGEEDHELLKAFEDHLAATRTALAEAASASLAITGEKLSDCEEGGCTRVTSVTYSERIVDVDDGEVTATSTAASSTGVAPSLQRMEQHMETEQRRQLEMARKTSELRGNILAQLINMDDAEREEVLKRAKAANQEFLTQAMSIPPGVERVEFLRAVDEDTQKMLLMHKLWEGQCASSKINGRRRTVSSDHASKTAMPAESGVRHRHPQREI